MSCPDPRLASEVELNRHAFFGSRHGNHFYMVRNKTFCQPYRSMILDEIAFKEICIRNHLVQLHHLFHRSHVVPAWVHLCVYVTVLNTDRLWKLISNWGRTSLSICGLSKWSFLPGMFKFWIFWWRRLLKILGPSPRVIWHYGNSCLDLAWWSFILVPIK